ncbi:MAG: LysM peptidoglycan-binding domain-containing protein [Gammaproteobacteria bacterium]
MLLAALLTGSLVAADVALNPNHPDRYVVVRGDTLWDISAMFLRDPWLWPEVWYVNPQVDNPHLIYPGDVLNLVYVDGKPRIQVSGDGKLSPRIREESLENAIPTIPLGVIKQFLTRALVVEEEGELDAAPYVVQSADEHVITGAGDRVYVRGIDSTDVTLFDIYEPGGAYIDPDTDELLGYEAIFVGTGPVQRFGDPATVKLTKTTREVRVGDRLLPADRSEPTAFFQPHATPPGTEGHIISVLNGVSQIGQFDVIAMDLGERDGMEVGHVMRIFQKGDVIRDPVSNKYGDEVTLPDEDAGLVMIFRTYEKVSFGLVMKATRAMHIHDLVRSP